VISIGKLRNADYYEREVVDGAEDYYVGSGEAPGRWVGSLAAELGLDGNVDGDQLRALFELRHPLTDEALLSTRATKPGFDVTISAPKSVSVLWALGDAGTSATVVDSLWSAVDDTRRYLEANACSVRRGHAGVDVTGMPSAHWTPLRGAASLQGAAATAKALVDSAQRGERGGDSHWLKQAEILLTSLLWLAANTEKRTITDVVDWVLGLDRPTETSSGTVAPLLRAHIDGDDPALAAGATPVHRWMKGLWDLDPRTSSSIYATARTAIWPWADPDVAAVSEDCDIDLNWLLTGTNTLYLATPLADQDRLAPVLGGLISDW
jgi:hypothetical protein